jgi:hypothetical protein
MKLFAPEEYWSTPPHILDEIVNGCGPGGIGDALVPDNIDWPWPWGLSITPSCRIHDYMYFVGETIDDKKAADRVFLNNMVRQIDAAGGFFLLKRRRKNRAWIYYQAVYRFGGPAFWSGKNKPEEERDV